MGTRPNEAGFSDAYPDVHTYLTIVARQLFNAKQPALQNDDEVKRQKRDADDFNRIVTALLGMPIKWQIQAELGIHFHWSWGGASVQANSRMGRRSFSPGRSSSTGNANISPPRS